jgi:hypothetical protein
MQHILTVFIQQGKGRVERRHLRLWCCLGTGKDLLNCQSGSQQQYSHPQEK